jgi:hypothetical protein
MSTHKCKNEYHHKSRNQFLQIVLLALILFVAVSIWGNDGDMMSRTVESGGGFFDVIFGFIGGVIDTVFGLVFGVIGAVLGLVGTVIGLVLGFVGLVLGLVFGALGIVFSLIIPLAIIVLAVKLLGSNNSPRDEKQKRKREWHNDDIVDV